jgi:predicted metal-dependent hydrolase
MQTLLMLDGEMLHVIKKDVEAVRLSVCPWSGLVTIVTPMRMAFYTAREFALARLGWIRHQQKRSRAQRRAITREYITRESRYVWGRCCLLTVEEKDAPPSVQLKHFRLLLRVRPGADEAKREAVMASWYRQLLKNAVRPLIAKWESRLHVTVNGFYVRRMTTMWGTHNAAARTIRLNTELATKPSECLDYIVLHEMVHLLAPTHCSESVALMDSLMPTWRETRDLLNRMPEPHEHWSPITVSS